uniref:Ig-like domain-containing protein n=1 Tax=Sparus aurata TaxID=8175 RepID=A0A671V7M5_SPAAU
MTGMRHLTCLWILFVTHNGCVCSDIQFLERQEGESVVLPCVVEPRTPPPYGLSLTRSWLHRSKVMYMHTESEVHVFNADDKNRTRVSGDPSRHSLNVTISDLRASDTDRYYCEFEVENPNREDLRLPGKTEFFLLVTAGGQCSCSSYSSLLYALSSAVAILLLFLLLAFVVIYKGKSRRSVKPHPQAPIYEEMTGLKAANRKLGPLHLEETQSSEYRNCPVKKSCPENYYESPRKDSLK